MPQPINLQSTALLAIPRASLAALRSALIRDAGVHAAGYLQEAGYAGGPAVFDAFAGWLRDRGLPSPDALGVSDFERRAAEFFAEAGWGNVAVGALGDAVATLDSIDWGEADPESGLDQPGCHYSAGMFADFFGRVADAPLAVMEVECRSAGADRCRFLLGSPDTLGALYEAMAGGETYENAVVNV
jgi:uncharacterized protein